MEISILEFNCWFSRARIDNHQSQKQLQVWLTFSFAFKLSAIILLSVIYFYVYFFRELSLYTRYIQKKPGYVKYIEFDVDQQRLDQLYEMILSFQLTE